MNGHQNRGQRLPARCRLWRVAAWGEFAAIALAPVLCQAHGYEGARYFPATIQTDDPFAVDEFVFPTVSTLNTPGEDGLPTRETGVGLEFTKEIFPGFALGVSERFVNLAPEGLPSFNGFENLGLGAKYKLWDNAPHEAIFSAGLEWEVGGTGSGKIGAGGGHVFAPALYLGKGLGDLPDSLHYLKPVALTAVLAQTLPTRAEPNTIEWGFALEYSLPYLQSSVKDIGLPAPLKDMIPLVEFAFET